MFPRGAKSDITGRCEVRVLLTTVGNDSGGRNSDTCIHGGLLDVRQTSTTSPQEWDNAAKKLVHLDDQISHSGEFVAT